MTSVAYEARKQNELDKLYLTYEEEGIQVAPAQFPISYFFARRMAKAKINMELGYMSRKNVHVHVEEIVGTEVANGIFIVKEGDTYYLEYDDSEQMEKYIEYWLNIF